MVPSSFSPDGRRLAYHETNPQTGRDLWTVTLDTSGSEPAKVGKPEPFLNTSINDWHPAFSPDGRWVAHTSDGSGPGEIYVRAFPGPGSKSKISTGGGNNATWAPNGRELYFRNADGRIMVTDYTARGDSFVVGKPRVWADTQTGITSFGRDFSLSPDGKRFAVTPSREPPPQIGSVHLTFVLNFVDNLRRKMNLSQMTAI
jgi:Tol biopolymer transport system component